MKKRVSVTILLYFLMLIMAAVTVGCSKSDDASTTTYTISGTITGASNVTITLSGDSSGSTIVAASGGSYSFNVSNGNYTVTPVCSGYVFDPVSTSVKVNGSNMIAGFDAASSVITYTVSGVVTGAANVTMNLTDTSDNPRGSFITGANATTYTSSGLAANTYVLTPYLSGYAFSPANLTVDLNGGNYTGANFTASAVNFTPADLAGAWNYQLVLHTYPSRWARGDVEIATNGTMTFISYLDSSNVKTLPSSVTLTINAITGVITDSGNAANHYTMASNKKLIAGTQDNGGALPYALIILQKKVPGTSYAESDLQSKNFVDHQLAVGTCFSWEYGSGSTSSSGEITQSSKTTPTAGTTTTPDDLGSISVDSNGIVTMSGNATFGGFLSADKKTIVGTSTTDSIGTYSMMIVNLIDGQSSSTGGVAGAWYYHMLTPGSLYNFWAYQSVGITGGVVSFNDDWMCSVPLPGPTGSETISVTPSGTVTMSGTSMLETTFNGQVSYDGSFIVATQMPGDGEYSLMVFTKKP
jgi:hypothetical protein